MNMVEKTGKTVEDAVKAALAVLGVSRDQVDVEVLEESKSSILGLFGGRDAKVRVTVKEVPAEEPSVPEPVAEIPEEKPEPAKGEVPEEPVQETKAPADRDAERQAVAAAAKTFLEEVFRAMGMDLLIEKFISRKDEEIILKIHGDGIGVLIGKHGQTLDGQAAGEGLAGDPVEVGAVHGVIAPVKADGLHIHRAVEQFRPPGPDAQGVFYVILGRDRGENSQIVDAILVAAAVDGYGFPDHGLSVHRSGHDAICHKLASCPWDFNTVYAAESRHVILTLKNSRNAV